jgi:hypothetical protein
MPSAFCGSAGALGLARAPATNTVEQKSGVIQQDHVLRAENFLLVASGTPEQNDRANRSS